MLKQMFKVYSLFSVVFYLSGGKGEDNDVQEREEGEKDAFLQG